MVNLSAWEGTKPNLEYGIGIEFCYGVWESRYTGVGVCIGVRGVVLESDIDQ